MADYAGSFFPSLLPRVADSHWFNVDKPCDDEEELSKLEDELADWVCISSVIDWAIIRVDPSISIMCTVTFGT